MRDFRDILNEAFPDIATSGQLIKAFRRNFNISQEDLAEVTGIQRTNLSAIENDKIEMTVHYAEILGAALGIAPASILFPNGEYKKSPEILEIEKRARKKFFAKVKA